MWTTAVNDHNICQSVSLSHGFKQLCCANTGKRIKVLLEVETLKCRSYYVNSEKHGSSDFPHRFDVTEFTLATCPKLMQTSTYTAFSIDQF